MKSYPYDVIVAGPHEMTRLSALGRPAANFISTNAPGWSPKKVFTLGSVGSPWSGGLTRRSSRATRT
jgi:hypothetical protein